FFRCGKPRCPDDSPPSWPRTAAGKLRSSQNAIPHGLLAKKFAPPPTGRNDNAEFFHLLRGLRGDRSPTTTQGEFLLKLLASKMLNLSRICAIREAIVAR